MTSKPPLKDAEGEAAEAAYIKSCEELRSALDELNGSLSSYIGNRGEHMEVFRHTRARLAAELDVAGGR